MNPKSRILGVIEAELRKNLWFVFSIPEVTHLSAHSLEPGDRFQLVVTACNQSAVPFKRISGMIAPSMVADFFPKRFSIATLGPREQTLAATLEAELVHAPSRGLLLDQLGTVSVSAQADLSSFRFHEADKPLIAVGPSLGADNNQGMGRLRLAAERTFPAGPSRSIALSDNSH